MMVSMNAAKSSLYIKNYASASLTSVIEINDPLESKRIPFPQNALAA